MKDESQQQQIVQALKDRGVTCRSCWWQEGGRCYVVGCERVPIPNSVGSISTKLADAVCENHSSKRDVLGKFFPDGMLTIASEQNAKDPKNY